MSPTAIKVLIIALFLSLVSSLFVNYNYYTEDVRKKLWEKKVETSLNHDPDINNGENYNNTQF